jgi:hypothetical protein
VACGAGHQAPEYKIMLDQTATACRVDFTLLINRESAVTGDADQVIVAVSERSL